MTKINLKIGWDNLLKTRSNVFVMEEVPTRSIGQGIDSKEYRSAETKGKTADNATLNGIDADIKSVSSLEPSPPTPPPNVVTASATEIGLPPNSAEGKATEERTVLADRKSVV